MYIYRVEKLEKTPYYLPKGPLIRVSFSVPLGIDKVTIIAAMFGRMARQTISDKLMYAVDEVSLVKSIISKFLDLLYEEVKTEDARKIIEKLLQVLYM